MMIKYRTYFDKITAEEVKRETAKKVFLPNGRSESKATSYFSWHDTWEEAHAHLVKGAEDKVERLRLNLARANGILGQIKCMKPSVTAVSSKSEHLPTK